MTYKDIDKVNSEINMIDLKGKNYAMVPERVTAFRKLYPEGFIVTDIIENDGTTVLMQAKVGYYKENGEPVTIASGFAQEVRGKGMVNGTSHIENCETSAVGRALGMIGLGINGGGICSAEELVNAITAQNQMKKEKQEKEETQTQAYLRKSIPLMMQAFGITEETKMKKYIAEWKKALIAGGILPDIRFEDMTVAQAEQLIEAIYANYKPGDAA